MIFPLVASSLHPLPKCSMPHLQYRPYSLPSPLTVFKIRRNHPNFITELGKEVEAQAFTRTSGGLCGAPVPHHWARWRLGPFPAPVHCAQSQISALLSLKC